MQGWVFLALLLGALGFLALRSFLRPRGVYLRSVGGVLLVTLGWAGFWLVMSPSNEAGFGFFAIWVVLVALVSCLAIAACAGATARYIYEGLRVRA
ncbi:MAG: hypothetical protein K2P58_11590 [Hyphomonadaceae bacterium]|nr:hypothetical protein [Hyphomonadaceae bacterium]